MAYVAAGNSAQEINVDWLTRTLSVVDAWLWIVFVLLFVAREAEQFWGVLSGFTLLLGPYPTLLAGAALIVGGAAYLTATTHAGHRLLCLMWWLRNGRGAATATVEATTPQPEWKVRTQPRTQTQRRGKASQRVMEMEL